MRKVGQRGKCLVQRVRAVVLTGFLEVARFVGLEPFEQLRRSRIRPDELGNPENWIAARSVANLLERCASEAGRSDFAILMAECRDFSSLGPVSLLLKHEASLRQIILRFDQFKRQLNEVVGVHLEESADVAVVKWTVPADYFTPQILTLAAAMGYRALVDAMNGSWTPATIHLPFQTPPHSASYHRYFASRLEFGSEFCGFSFPATDLDQPNPVADAPMANHAASLLKLVPTPTDGITDRTKHALSLLLPSGKATLRNVARNLGTGPRTLQRKLASEDLTFAELLNEARRCLAADYVSNPALRIHEIAGLLGYANVSAFSRWFTGQFGVPPARKRADLQKSLIDSRPIG